MKTQLENKKAVQNKIPKNVILYDLLIKNKERIKSLYQKELLTPSVAVELKHTQALDPSNVLTVENEEYENVKNN